MKKCLPLLFLLVFVSCLHAEQTFTLSSNIMESRHEIRIKALQFLTSLEDSLKRDQWIQTRLVLKHLAAYLEHTLPVTINDSADPLEVIFRAKQAVIDRKNWELNSFIEELWPALHAPLTQEEKSSLARIDTATREAIQALKDRNKEWFEKNCEDPEHAKLIRMAVHARKTNTSPAIRRVDIVKLEGKGSYYRLMIQDISISTLLFVSEKDNFSGFDQRHFLGYMNTRGGFTLFIPVSGKGPYVLRPRVPVIKEKPFLSGQESWIDFFKDS